MMTVGYPIRPLAVTVSGLPLVSRLHLAGEPSDGPSHPFRLVTSAQLP